MLRYKIIHEKYTDLFVTAEYEHGTIDGWTYFSGEFHNPANLDIEDVELTEELRDKLKQISPHYKLINTRVVEKIREKYSLTDEIGLIRKDGEEKDVYDAYVDECIQWGRAEKQKIGF